MAEVVRIYLLGEIISILIWYFIPPIFFRMRNKQKRIKIMQEYITNSTDCDSFLCQILTISNRIFLHKNPDYDRLKNRRNLV